MKAGNGLLDARHGRAEISLRRVQAASNSDHLLQVFAENFVLRRLLFDRCQRAEAGRVTRRAVEDGVLNRVQ